MMRPSEYAMSFGYRQDHAEAVEDAIRSYSAIRNWPEAAQNNLVMTILGSLAYVVPEIQSKPRQKALGKTDTVEDQAHD